MMTGVAISNGDFGGASNGWIVGQGLQSGGSGFQSGGSSSGSRGSLTQVQYGLVLGVPLKRKSMSRACGFGICAPV
jgi:hypothetical protein